MKSLFITGTLGLCLAPVLGTQAAQKGKPVRPNIVFILADDLGWNDLACTGSKYYETPNIDRLAASGITFINSYAACQVSSPSRASILTGKTPARHGITNWIGEASSEEWEKMGRHSKLLPAEYVHALPAEDTTLAEDLRDHGYTTFFAGKWHLGDTGSSPEDHGFQINKGGYWAGSPRGGYFVPYDNPKLPDGPAGENLSMRLAKETVSFLDKQVKTKKHTPFLAYLSFYAVHGPIETTQANWQYFKDKAVKAGVQESGFLFDRMLPVRKNQDNPVYAGLIKQMDDAVGVVLDEVKRLGIEKNTIIIFTSDNGGVSSGDSFSTSCFPLRGGKGRQWEGGFRVPLILKTLDNVHKDITEPVIDMDLYPTILDLAGLPLLPKQHVDGQSLKPVIYDGKTYDRAFYWHYPHYGNQGGEPSSVIRKGDWKLIHYYEDGRDELYNLVIDPGEHEPLNAQYPEKIKELRPMLDAWLKETGARLPKPDPKYNPLEEAAYKDKMQNVLMKDLEKERHDMLQEGWKPNATWWGSKITND